MTIISSLDQILASKQAATVQARQANEKPIRFLQVLDAEFQIMQGWKDLLSATINNIPKGIYGLTFTSKK